MSSFAFQRDGGEWSREEWRAVDRAVYRWVRAHGGSALLAATAAWASLADGDADAALPLADLNRYGMPPLPAADIERLRAEPLVAGEGDAGPVRPFVLDAANRFYLWRNHAHECAAADAIRARRAVSAGPRAGAAAASEADLDLLFSGDRGARVQAQREAVRAVAGRRWFVLTGGPGTGKTTTVLRMLLMLQRLAPRRLAIQIAAPTGKAAQRLLQALRQGKRDLRGSSGAPLPADWQPLLDAIPDSEALTVHRLLGYQPWRNAFRRNRRDPIGADVVVVDEASMLDLSMLRSLVEAIRDDAMLLLVGDADQLSSVATGSVLMDIVAAQEADGRGDVARLAHSFRAEQQLVALNDAVRTGDGDAIRRPLAAGNGDVALRAVETPRQLADQLGRWSDELAGADLRPLLSVDAGTARDALVRSALAALAQRQLLCALREGEFGALAANAAIERRLRRLWQVADHAEWYPGRAVMITRNDYGAGLFNGDVGLCLADRDGGTHVWFEAPAADAGGGGSALRSFSPNLLPAHEGAFALTIHKSQGSEYGHAAVLLPPDGDNRILSRQLLYTGVSRARRRVEIWSSELALETALRRSLVRYGGLRERLLGAPQTALPAPPDSPRQQAFAF